MVTFDTPNPCSIAQVLWSPDGTQIALRSNSPVDTRIYLLAVATVPSALLQFPFPPSVGQPNAVASSVNVPVELVAVLAGLQFQDGSLMTWTPDGRALTFVSGEQHSLIQLDIATNAQHTLLTIDDKAVLLSGPTWTLDGKHVLFEASETNGKCMAAVETSISIPRQFRC